MHSSRIALFGLTAFRLWIAGLSRAPLALALGGLVLLPGARALGAEVEYNINVRSDVDRPFKGLGREPLVEHGKVYAIVSIEQIDNPENKLVRPVNEYMLLKNLRRVLTDHGFREAPEGTVPEILLTVLYGRGWLQNPYLDDGTINPYGGVDGVTGGGAPTVTIVGVPKDIIRHKDAFFDEKAQRAESEKLIINITAWKYPEPRKPGEKKQKPRQYWRTTINTDDADQDLNALMEKMLRAGAVYFDRVIDKEEVTVSSALPEGHVKVGIPMVVEPNKAPSQPPKTPGPTPPPAPQSQRQR